MEQQGEGGEQAASAGSSSSSRHPIASGAMDKHAQPHPALPPQSAPVPLAAASDPHVTAERHAGGWKGHAEVTGAGRYESPLAHAPHAPLSTADAAAAPTPKIAAPASDVGASVAGPSRPLPGPPSSPAPSFLGGWTDDSSTALPADSPSSDTPPPHPLTVAPIVPAHNSSAKVAISTLLWAGVLFLYFCLAFYLTGLIYDVWTEEEDGSAAGKTVSRVRGKGAVQWLLLSATCVQGLTAALLLTARLFALTRAKPWFKLVAIGLVCFMLITGHYSYTTYDGSVDRAEYPRAREGAGAEYTHDAFKYNIVSLACLVTHEVLVRVVQRVRTKAHLDLYMRRMLRVLKNQPAEVQHALQRESIASIVQPHAAGTNGRTGQTQDDAGEVTRVAIVGVDDGSSSTSSRATPPSRTSTDPPHSRPTGLAVGGGVSEEHHDRLLAQLLASKDHLTPAQLNLLFSLVAFMATVQAGALAYAHIEGWDLRQSLLFTTVTLATIGYGDVVPKTDLGRSLLFLYFPLGFGILSYTIALVWTQLFQKADIHFGELQRAAVLYVWKPFKLWRQKKKLEMRRRGLETAKRQRRRQGVLQGEGQGHAPTPAPTAPTSGSTTGTGAKLPLHPVPDPDLELGRSVPHRGLTAALQRAHTLAALDAVLAAEEAAIVAEEREQERLDREHAAAAVLGVVRDANEAPSATTNHKLALSFVFVLLLLLGGAALFCQYEPKWSYFDSVYFCFCTLTTIGFGDFAPTTPESKTLITYYVIVGLGALTYVLSLINEKITQGMNKTKGVEEDMERKEEQEQAEEEEKKQQQQEQEEHEKRQIAERRAAELAAAAISRTLATLPSWNDQFVTLQLVLEQLDERAAVLARTQQPMPPAFAASLHALTSSLGSLALTVAQRRSGQREASMSRMDGGSRAHMPPSDGGTGAARARASSVSARRRSGSFAGGSDDNRDDDIDLSSYGIGLARILQESERARPTAPTGQAAAGATPGKKQSRVVVPRSYSYHLGVPEREGAIAGNRESEAAGSDVPPSDTATEPA